MLDGIDEDGNISNDAESAVMGRLRESFRPEFLNRLDEIIMFKPLGKEQLRGIIGLVIKDLNERVKERGISISVDSKAEEYITENAYDPNYGARPLKRFIQKNVETMLGRLILSGDVSEGEEVLLTVEDDGLTIKKA